MKKWFLIPLLLYVLSAAAFAGTLNISGRAGIYNPGNGIASSAIYGIGADYGITSNILIRGAVETTSYTVAGNTVSYTPITADLIYRYPIFDILTPYVGAGLSYDSFPERPHSPPPATRGSPGSGLISAGCTRELNIATSFPTQAIPTGTRRARTGTSREDLDRAS